MEPTITSTQPLLTRWEYAALSEVADRGDTYTISNTSRFLLVDAGLITRNTDPLGGTANAELTDAGRAALAAGLPPVDDSAALNFKVGAAERACRDLLARTDLPLQARGTVEALALTLGVDDPHEDGATTGGGRA